MLSLLALVSLAACVNAWLPTNSYAPGKVLCPSVDLLVRNASSLSTEEKEWVASRNEVTDDNLVDFLTHANMTDFDASTYIHSTNNGSIKIGVAFSGGGYRAMLNGAGQLSGLDNRTEGAWEHGLGGLIESATYVTGLLGGNWMLGTVALNNWTSVQDIINQDTIWNLEHAIYAEGGWNIFKTAETWDDISDDLQDKRDAGFNVSFTDAWGRALLNQFFGNYPSSGAALTWSTLRDADVFSGHQMPFPIVVADGRTPGTQLISENSTVFEFSPLEMGLWDPLLHGFVDIKYIGLNLTNGVPVSNGLCIAGYDNGGFVMGTLSSLFNQFLLQLNTTGLSGILLELVQGVLTDVLDDYNDIAVYRPNPFFGLELAGLELIVNSDTLYLVDGGEDLQNVPLWPLLQEERDLDVVFAFDNSADTDYSWPNGTSLVATYERQFSNQGAGVAFPYVPDTNTFRALNLTAKPTFFGCNASNLTDLARTPPLVVYMANRPFSVFLNTLTYKMLYSEEEKLNVIQNGFEVATRNNMTLDSEWRACVGCAIIRRLQERLDIEQLAQCQKCFQEYCWDGQLSSEDVLSDVNFTSTGITSGDESNGTTKASGALVAGKDGMRAVVWAAVAAVAVMMAV